MIIRLINLQTSKSIDFFSGTETTPPDLEKLEFPLLEGFEGIFNLPNNIIYSVEKPFTNDNVFLGNRYDKREILLPTRIQNQVLTGRTTVTREINKTIFQDNSQLILEIVTDEIDGTTGDRLTFEIKDVSCINNPIDSRTGVFSYSFDFELETMDPHIYGLTKFLALGLSGEEQGELAFEAAVGIAFESGEGISFNSNQLQNPNDIINAGDVPMDLQVFYFGESAQSWIQIGLNDFDPDLPDSGGNPYAEFFVGVDNSLATVDDFNAVFTRRQLAFKNFNRNGEIGDNAINELIGDFFKVPEGENVIFFQAKGEGVVNKPGVIILYQPKFLSL